jgi:hypothetical protein
VKIVVDVGFVIIRCGMVLGITIVFIYFIVSKEGLES